ncbi:MAG: carboxypeptidase-like regulatory domain-containing protein [bacterium]|nr:carboxypeptidase-like regulatory domain-containing protein [bacterium]
MVFRKNIKSKIYSKIRVFTLCILFFFFASLLSAQSVFALSQSTNYKLRGGQVNTISTNASSPTYNLETGGQNIAGKVLGSSYNVRQGSAFSGRAVVEEETSPIPPSLGGGFPTLPLGYINLPEITQLKIVDIGSSQARIIFDTAKLAVSRIQYGIGDKYDLITDTEISFATKHEFLLYNLTPNSQYKFVINLRNLESNTAQSGAYTFTTLRVFKAVPNPSKFIVQAKVSAINLSWDNPDIADFGGVKLIRSTSYYPSSLNDGVLLLDSSQESYSDYDVVPDKKYYYTLFSYDTSFNYSSGAIASAIIVSEITKEPVVEKPVVGEPVVEKPVAEEPLVEEEIIIPAEPPALPVGLIPIEEKIRLDDTLTPEEKIILEERIRLRERFTKLFGFVEQSIGKEYEKITRVFGDFVNLNVKQINQIKAGLISNSGQLQQDVYKLLTPSEKKQIEEIIATSLPATFEYGEVTNVFMDFLNSSERQINTIRPNLIIKDNKVQLDVYEMLTPDEIKQIEEIINTPLPPTFDYEKISQVFRNLLGKNIDQINQVKDGLIITTNQLQQNIYEMLTFDERKQIEEIINNQLPPTFEFKSVVSVSPFNLEAEEDNVDWHIFADSDSLLTIPADIFDKPVSTIIVTIRTEAYILAYNAKTNSYEAVIKAPSEKGKYQMIVQVIYTDNSYEEFRKVAMVDPYGYLYIEKYKPWSWAKPWQIFQKEEFRVPEGKITLYNLNRVNEWVIWPANFYRQYNPQTTNDTGEFLFIAPPGKYYLTAEAIGFKRFVGDEFEVSQDIINVNIKLNNLFSWAGFIQWIFRWGLILIIPLILLLLLLLLGIRIGMKMEMKKAIKKKVKQGDEQPPDHLIT